MDVTLHIPDHLAPLLGPADDLPRQALEMLALQRYRHGHLSRQEVRQLLGIEMNAQLDELMARYGMYEDFTMKDYLQDRAELKLALRE